jgi:hypothetical protein
LSGHRREQIRQAHRGSNGTSPAGWHRRCRVRGLRRLAARRRAIMATSRETPCCSGGRSSSKRSRVWSARTAGLRSSSTSGPPGSTSIACT